AGRAWACPMHAGARDGAGDNGVAEGPHQRPPGLCRPGDGRPRWSHQRRASWNDRLRESRPVAAGCVKMDELERGPEAEREHLVVEETVPPASETSSAERLASAVGNEAFARVATEGAGLLPDGRVHPVVESTIARTRGGGQPLDQRSRERFSGPLGD